jgi:tetratricopeptide (TPR) repeat protein
VLTRFHLSKALTLLLVLAGLLLMAASAFSGDPVKAKEHFNSAINLAGEKKDSLAIEEYKSAIKEDPQYTDAYINLGSLYFKSEKFNDALTNFKKATEIDPKNADAWANLGRTYFKLDKNTDADNAYKTTLSIKSDYYDIYKDIGLLYYAQSNWSGLVDNMKIYTEKVPTDQMGFYLLGKGYQSLKKYPEAIAAFDKSIELNKDNFFAYSALGKIYQAQENYGEAVKMFEQATRVKPDNYLATRDLAISFEQINQDKTDQVIAYWNKFIKSAKNNPRAKNLVQEAEAHIKDLEAAKGAN